MGGSTMFGFRGGWGFGFRGGSPPWPYVGRGRGGLPRCWYFLGATGAPVAPGYGPYPYYSAAWGMPYGATATPGPIPFAPQMTKEQEFDFLRSEAEAVKEQLEQIEARIRDLEKEGEP
jgi:hypothetical protein